MPLRICFIASEVAPLAKTGGLADVAGALPRYLHDRGHDVRVFMPLYSSISLGPLNPQPVDAVQDVDLRLGPHRYTFSLLAATLPSSQTPVMLVHCPAAFDRPTIYTNGPDEHLRFLVLQRAALESCQRLAFAPQILHCNDWHTGLAPLMLKSLYAWDQLFDATRTVMSIHNIGYQGVFAAGTAHDVGGEIRHLLAPEDASRGQINWLREGLRHADRVSTVSPTYAQEICSPIGSHGLDTTLRARGDEVVGILNGVDYSEWNPATDRYLKYRFSPDRSVRQGENQARLPRLAESVAPGHDADARYRLAHDSAEGLRPAVRHAARDAGRPRLLSCRGGQRRRPL